MRFLSRYGKYGVQIRPQIQEAYATGMAKVTQEPVYAQFEVGFLLPHERELAINRWSWNGALQHLDEATFVEPDYRIGVFDSERAQVEKSWTDEVRLEVERKLLDLCDFYDNIIAVPATMIPPPWPLYDDYGGSVESLLQKLVEDGHNLDAVLTYERATQKREKVIEGLEILLSDPEAVEGLRPEAEEVVG